MTISIAPHLIKLTAKRNLSRGESSALIEAFMSGEVPAEQMAEALLALKSKGETVEEITGAALAMRRKAEPFPLPAALQQNAIDTCGTGGDNQHTYNISTAAAFVIAGAGVPVVKHGNKAVSSKSGSADVLRTLGVNVDMREQTALRCLEHANICFLMAPRYHAAMKHVAPVRQELKTRTIFNLLGPLTNPAGVKRQVVGVFSKAWVEPIAQVLKELGSIHAWVAHGEDGMDEMTTTTPTFVAELKNGKIRTFTIEPEKLGIPLARPENLRGGDAETNAKALRDVLEGKPSPYADIVILNAAAGLIVGGGAGVLKEGVDIARHSITKGSALKSLENLARISQS